MILRLVLYQITAVPCRLFGTVVQEEALGMNNAVVPSDHFLFITTTRYSGDLENDIGTLVKITKGELSREGRKLEVEWVDSGTIQR